MLVDTAHLLIIGSFFEIKVRIIHEKIRYVNVVIQIIRHSNFDMFFIHTGTMLTIFSVIYLFNITCWIVTVLQSICTQCWYVEIFNGRSTDKKGNKISNRYIAFHRIF